jgi:hypothetical protein
MNKKPKPEITEFNEQRLSNLNADAFATALRKSRGNGLVTTLLMPMERRGAETRKNHIVFKNLLREARESLPAERTEAAEMAARLAALESFEAPTHGFWQSQEEGLAMVVEASGRVTAYKVPFPLEPYVRLDQQPYLSPLLRLAGGKIYHVLALDLNELKLYRATAWQIEEVKLENVPTSLEEAMKYDDPEESLQWRGVSQQVSPSTQPGGGRPIAAYHGHGVTGEETRRVKIKRFLEMVDKDLATNFDNKERPLVLLGPPAEIGTYRSVNRYPHLHDEPIQTNPSSLTPDELRDRICGWVREHDLRDRRLALEALRDNLGIGEGSLHFEEIVLAAGDGRISTLFVRGGERRYGVADRANGRVSVHPEPRDGDEELVELAVLAAAEGAAAIHYIEKEEDLLPDGVCLAAIFRYKT